ncbi:SGNH/GDSL hydrolase family protein [candidate division KSB1 bacterium]
MNIEKLSFRYKLSHDSYFTLLFSSENDTLSGIRISNDPAYPSMLLQIFNGAFLVKKPIKIESAKDDWTNMELKFDDNEISIMIKGVVNDVIINTKDGGNVLGFRGCGNSTFIDDVLVNQKNTDQIFHDDFSKHYSHLLFLIIAFIGFNLCFVLLFKRKKFILVLMVNIAVISLFIYLFFELYGQEKYPKEWMIRWQSKTSKIETEQSVSNRILAQHADSDNKDIITILFSGSSQTWGAGATSEETTLMKRFEKIMNEACDKKEVVCINTSVSGKRSEDLLKSYKEQWIKIQPDIQILNIALNDCGNPDYKRNLEEFVSLNRKHNIITIFALEPTAVYNRAHFRNHRIMEEIGKANNLLVVDMNSYLKEYDGDGFIWWDFIHLTDFGQKLFAEKLFDELFVLICDNITYEKTK